MSPWMTSRCEGQTSPAIVRVTSGTSRMARRRTSIPLYSRMSPSASSLVGPLRTPRGTGLAARQVRRQVRDGDPAGAELVGELGLLRAVDERRRRPW